jgi:hypothetical protein
MITDFIHPRVAATGHGQLIRARRRRLVEDRRLLLSAVAIGFLVRQLTLDSAGVVGRPENVLETATSPERLDRHGFIVAAGDRLALQTASVSAPDESPDGRRPPLRAAVRGRGSIAGPSVPRPAPHLRRADVRRRRPPEVPSGADGPLLDPRHARPLRPPLPGREPGRTREPPRACDPIHTHRANGSKPRRTKSPRKQGLRRRERRDSNPRPPA